MEWKSSVSLPYHHRRSKSKRRMKKEQINRYVIVWLTKRKILPHNNRNGSTCGSVCVCAQRITMKWHANHETLHSTLCWIIILERDNHFKSIISLSPSSSTSISCSSIHVAIKKTVIYISIWDYNIAYGRKLMEFFRFGCGFEIKKRKRIHKNEPSLAKRW